MDSLEGEGEGGMKCRDCREIHELKDSGRYFCEWSGAEMTPEVASIEMNEDDCEGFKRKR